MSRHAEHTHAEHSTAEHAPRHDSRLEVRCTARRHRSLVRGADAAVLLGVLGYHPDQPGSRVPAAELLTRARAWQAHHDPHAVRDPDSAGEIDWTPAPDALTAYRRSPADYRRVFSAFTLTARPPQVGDWITWRSR